MRSFLRTATSLLLALFATGSAVADWPQWRGPLRNGVVESSPKLSKQWPKEGPKLLWESETFPARSGEGSVVVAGGLVYVLVNRQVDETIETRTLDKHVLGKLHWFRHDEIPAEVLTRVEKARLERPVELRGRALREWTRTWVDKHLPEEDKKLKRWRGTAERRLNAGPEATPLDVVMKLTSAKDRVFPDHAALEKWLDAQSIDDPWRGKILDNVLRVRQLGRDVVLCLDEISGETRWKRELPGKLDRQNGSSTPCVVDGRIYVAGTTHAHCLDAKTGDPIWSRELPGGGTSSSFLWTKKAAFLLAHHLTALDPADGSVLWTQDAVRGRRSSPVRWTVNGRGYLLLNTDKKQVVCVDEASGEVRWTAPGGGFGTAVVSDDRMVIPTRDEKIGLIAYEISPTDAREMWRRPREGRGAASPLVHDGHVYLAGSDTFECVELETGKVRWTKTARVEISSPVLVDGKILSVMGNGSFLTLIDATPDEYRELAKCRMRAARCPSPAISKGRLFLRMRDRVASFDLRGTKAGDS